MICPTYSYRLQRIQSTEVQLICLPSAAEFMKRKLRQLSVNVIVLCIFFVVVVVVGVSTVCWYCLSPPRTPTLRVSTVWITLPLNFALAKSGNSWMWTKILFINLINDHSNHDNQTQKSKFLSYNEYNEFQKKKKKKKKNTAICTGSTESTINDSIVPRELYTRRMIHSFDSIH